MHGVWLSWKEEGELNWPVGVAVDSRDMVFVSEMDNERTSVFTTEGQFVKSFGRHGTKPTTPCGWQ